jgi:putative ABC transport system substrate-binding protein
VMRRREFISLLGSAAVAWPLAARAQQGTMPGIGFLSSRSASDSAPVEAAFRRGLKESGYAEGENVHIAFRWADGQFTRLPALAGNLVSLRPAVIVAAGGEVTALAAREATRTIPIVFIIGIDPVKTGLVASLNRPGGNLTGVTLFTTPLSAKRLELLRELVPGAAVIAILANPNNPSVNLYRTDMSEAARTVGQQILFINASTEGEIEAAFATLTKQRVGALVILPDPFLNTRRDQIMALAARHAMPVIYDSREHVEAGGLMSYGASYSDVYRQGGIYTGRVLKGAKPADLPVLQPTKFELILNLTTAKALGLQVPDKLVALADEVIE